MNKDNIISALFDDCIGDDIKISDAMTEDDLKVVYDSLKAFVKKYNIPLSDESVIEADIIGEAAYIGEHRGYINGFKTAVRLFFEALR